jgi:hypothetical protein
LEGFVLRFSKANIFVVAGLVVATWWLVEQAQTASTPVRLTAKEDHQRVMKLLHIETLRRGVDNDPKSSYAANYDEAKAGPRGKLPDPLLMKNGKKVTTAEMWWTKRRPEIVAGFDREILGRVPGVIPKVRWELVATSRDDNDGLPIVKKRLVGHATGAAGTAPVHMELDLNVPADAKRPVPVIIELALTSEVLTALAKRYPEMHLDQKPAWKQIVIGKGWGYATYFPTSVQDDNGDGLTRGIIGLANGGQPRRLNDWGVLRAWAWGASRVLDYLETDSSVDAKRVGIEGHSRYGKAALIAMAYDPRFAVAYISSSGEGGAKLYRRHFGEEIGNLAGTGEYHWFAGNFLKYDGPLNDEDLPVDAHELIALCAPRPVFIGAGATQGDGWVDAKGMFLAEVASGPVYRLLGKKDLGTTQFPAIETALVDGDLAFRQHSEGHTPAPNWQTFLSFSERYFKSSAGAAQ